MPRNARTAPPGSCVPMTVPASTLRRADCCMGSVEEGGGVIKALRAFRRAPRMDRDEFQRRWEEHAALVLAVPGLRGYVQSPKVGRDEQSSAPFDGFSAMWFDDEDGRGARRRIARGSGRPHGLGHLHRGGRRRGGEHGRARPARRGHGRRGREAHLLLPPPGGPVARGVPPALVRGSRPAGHGVHRALRRSSRTMPSTPPTPTAPSPTSTGWWRRISTTWRRSRRPRRAPSTTSYAATSRTSSTSTGLAHGHRRARLPHAVRIALYTSPSCIGST